MTGTEETKRETEAHRLPHRSLVEMRGVEFSYGRQPLFSQLDMTLEPGNIYGLLGKNGAGKTSLLRLMAGLLFPQRGEVKVDGWEPAGRSADFLSEVYVLPEEFTLPRFTPGRYIDLYAAFYPRFDYEKMETYMREFEIPHETVLADLSYGQKKKFLLAFGLACESTLFLLDEPTNGLDIPSKSQFRRTVASAVNEDRIFIISTHQVRDVENLIDPVTIIDGGRIVFNRSFEEIYSTLKVQRFEHIPKDLDVVYSEADMKGFSVVTADRTRESGRERGDGRALDLELLFNTVVHNPEKVEEIFTEGGDNE